LRRWLTVAFTVGVLVLAARILEQRLAGVHWADVLAQLQTVRLPTVLAAIGCCALSYLCLAAHEVLALHHVAPGSHCSRRRAVVAALAAYPIGHAVGVGALSGGAVRLRWYAAAGLSLAEVGQVVVLCMIPYAVGLGVLFATSLLWHGEAAGRLLNLPLTWVLGVAVACLAVHVAYVTATFRLRGSWRWPRWMGGVVLTLPPGKFTLMQYAVGMVDVGSAAAILWLFLPATAGVEFVAFLPLYVLCIFAALASNVPAGLGVFESVLLLLLPTVAPEALLGAVLLYRCVFELLPLAVALLLLAATELAGKGRSPN
jgi:phosphatidylglycerol lysyltransferase